MKREWLVLGSYQEPILTLSNKEESLWNAMIGRSIYSPPYRFVKETQENTKRQRQFGEENMRNKTIRAGTLRRGGTLKKMKFEK